MKKIALLLFAVAFPVFGISASEEKPVQHLQIEDVSSMEDAKNIFVEKTYEIKSKRELSLVELQQIHVITYTLETSVAYFAKNLKGEKQKLANEMVLVVEDIHLSSENNKKDETKLHLEKYFNLVDKFIFGF